MTEDSLNLTRLVRIYPNKNERKFLIRNIRYRQECWNRGLKMWQHMYHQESQHLSKIIFTPNGKVKKFYNKYILVREHVFKDKNGEILKYKFTPVTRSYVPSGRNVRNQFIDLGKTQNSMYPNEVLTDTLLYDLDQSYQAFFDPARPDSKRPKIKYVIFDNGSYLDTQAHIKNGLVFPTLNRQMKHKKLYNQGIKVAENISDLNSNKRYTIRFIHRDHKFYAAISVKRPIMHLMPTGQVDAVDANVDHFNSTNYVLWLCKQPLYDKRKGKIVYKRTRLDRLYNRISYYQKALANKRNCVIKHAHKHHEKVDKSLWKTKNYRKIQLKLRQTYLKVYNIQHDLMQKYTTYLAKNHDEIYIEDLDVKHMKMGVASKGLHRSLFGYFRQTLEYKCKLYGRKLIIVDCLYPSTQVCPRCGMAKAGNNKITLTGNKKHGTPHNIFKCYHCGYEADRDVKVSSALVRYNSESMSEIIKRQKLSKDYQILGI